MVKKVKEKNKDTMLIPKRLIFIVIGVIAIGVLSLVLFLLLSQEKSESFSKSGNNIFTKVSNKIEEINPLQKTDSNKNKFKIAETSPNDFQNNFTIAGRPMIVFSKKLAVTEETLANYVSIEPEVPAKWKIEENQQVIFLQPNNINKNAKGLTKILKPHQGYTITVKKDISSTDEETLQEDQEIKFRTANSAAFPYYVKEKLISSSPDKSTKIDFGTNSSDKISDLSFQVSVYKATKEQLLKYFSNKNEDIFDRSILYSFGQPDTEPVMTFDKKMQSHSNTDFIEIPNISKQGLYYVKLNSDYGVEDLFLSNSRYAVQVFSDAKNINIWAVDTVNETVKSNMKMTAYDLYEGPTELFSGITDRKGLLKKPKQGSDILIGELDNNYAVVDLSGLTNINGRDEFRIFSSSDRPIYRPGDTIHYKAIIRKLKKGGLTLPKEENLAVRLYSGTVISPNYKEITPDEYGTVTTDFNIPKAKTDGTLLVELAQKKPDAEKDEYTVIDSLSLEVKPYNKPNLEITASFEKEEYISKDTAKVSLIAKTLYGAPFANIPFTYRVIANNYDENYDRDHDKVLYNDNRAYGQGKTFTQGENKFNKKGKAEIEFSTDLKNFEKSQALTIEVIPKINTSPSIAQNTTLVHRGDFALFTRDTVSNLSEGVHGKILSIDHQTPRQPVKNKKVYVELYKFKNSERGEKVSETELTTDETGQGNFDLNYREKGTYQLVVKSKDEKENTITMTQTIYLGDEPTGGYSSKSPFFTISVPEKDYIIGEKVQPKVESKKPNIPILYVITSGKHIRETYLSTASKPPEITVPNINTANLNVVAFAASNNQFYQQNANINSSMENVEIKTDILFEPSIAEPGADVTAKIKTTDKAGNPISADTALTLVDQSILQIQDYTKKDILKNMYDFSRWHGLSVYNSFSGINNHQGPPGAGGGCFLQGTKIRMADGSLKKIENVQKQSFISTRQSEYDGNIVPAKVTDTVQHTVDQYLEINNRLKVTEEHRLLINHRWMAAGQAKIGDYLLNETGKQVKITSIKEHKGLFQVYNLTTEPQHTFFAEGFYVHNEKGFTRTDFQDTAYWNPTIRTDNQGDATVSFTLPDNMTTYAALAYSNTKESQFGKGNASLISRRPLTVIPALADYYFQDDKPIISVVVQNSSQEKISGTLQINIPEINLSTKENISIEPNDYETVQTAIELTSKEKEITYSFIFKDESGKQLDGIELTQPLLPKGSIKTFWKSWQDNNSIEFSSQFPKAGLDKLNLSIYLHPLHNLVNYRNNYRYSGFAEKSSQELYSYSQIVSLVQKGYFQPHTVPYAYLTNTTRYELDKLLNVGTDLEEDSAIWENHSYEMSETELKLINAWSAMALKQIKQEGIFDDLPNIDKFIEKAKSYAQKPFTENEDLDKVKTNYLNAWVFDLDLPNNNRLYQNAIKTLRGENKVDKIIKEKIQSAEDRLLWQKDYYEDISPYIAALAIMLHGTDEQADKVIKGLTVNRTDYSNDEPLELLIAALHGARTKIKPDSAKLDLYIDEKKILSTENKEIDNKNIYQIKNVPINEMTTIEMKNNGTLPAYSTISYLGYQTNDYLPASQPSDLIKADYKLKRTNISLDGENSTETGKPQVIILSNEDTTLPFYNYDKYAEGVLMDFTSPQYVFLPQKGGNASQVDSLLEKKVEEIKTVQIGDDPVGSYIDTPIGYADQTVFFNSDNTKATLYYINTVYKLNEGEHYQPKTTLLYPDLGIAVEEE